MPGKLAYIIFVDEGRPDNSLPGGGGPVDPGYGRPDIGWGRPDQGLPGFPGRPDQGLPGFPGRPTPPIYNPPGLGGGQLPIWGAPGRPDQGLPGEGGGIPTHPIEVPEGTKVIVVWIPGLGYVYVPVGGGKPDQGLPGEGEPEPK